MLFPDSQIDEFVLALAAMIIAIGIIWAFARGAYKGIKRIEAALGIDEKGRTIAERLDNVEHQLFPNGGSSLADKVNRMEIRQVETDAKVATIEMMLGNFIKDGAR